MLVVLFFCLAGVAWAGSSPVVKPFEKAGPVRPWNGVDRHVLALLKKRGVTPAHLCSDEVFIRRVYLDVIGTLPFSWDVVKFVAEENPNKRALLIDRLMEREEFADYWSLKWCDLLRVKAEFPINLWPNGVQAFYHWVRGSIVKKMPYDVFVRALLTSSGSNFRVPPVNFYRAIQGQKPSSIAAAVGLTLMGARVEKWPRDRRVGLETFFSYVAFKGTAEWKEQIVYLDPSPRKSLVAIFPDGTRARIKPQDDPRVVFADWLITARNPWFTRVAVNRVWAWLMGRGIIHEPDDIRADNPPSNPRLLAYLQKELVRSDYDLRHIYKLILNSRTYQQSSIPQSKSPRAESLFAYYKVRQLDAEVLIDALVSVFGPREQYKSVIPEPYTFIPEEHRTIALADGSMTSQFLEMFGRPSRDTGYASERNNEPTEAQRLHMLNSTHIQKKIENSWRLRDFLKRAKGNRVKVIRELYLTILSRQPMPEEIKVAQAYAKSSKINSRQAAIDLAWALINTKEFLYHH